MWLAAVLWSLNDRAAGGPGLDVAPLTRRWMNDFLGLATIDKEEAPTRPEYHGPTGRPSRHLNDIED